MSGSAANTPARAPRTAAIAHRGDGKWGWLMAGPAIVLVLTFLIAPFVMAFWLSLTNARLISPNAPEFTGLDNFGRLLGVQLLSLAPERDADGAIVLDTDGAPVYPSLRSFTRNKEEFPQYAGMQEWFSVKVGDTRHIALAADVVFMKSLVNTIAFALVIVPLQSAFGLLLALLVNRRTRGVNAFRTIYFIPVVMSMVVISILWKFLYSPDGGMVNSFFGAITLGAFQPVDWLGNPTTALPAVMFMSMWQAVGFHMVIWLAGLQTIPPELYEAAGLDGAGRVAQFRNVTWPGLRNTSVFIFITITIAAFGLFTQIDVMTRGGPLDSTSTIVYQAVQQGFRTQDMGYGAAISVVFFVLVLAVALIQRRLTRETRG